MNRTNFRRVLLPFLAGFQMMLVSACGSSASGEANSQGVVFADPVDAPTLRQAIITGSTTTETDQFWLCSFGSDNRMLEYRLFADNSGTETDQSNPTVSSVFSWQALSATSMSTTVSASGMTLTFTGIQFSGSNAMSLSVENQTLSCTRKGVVAPAAPAPQAGENTLNYGSST